MELHHVAFPRDPQRMGDHGEAAKDQQIAPALAKRLVVGAAVHQAALHRAQILLPLILHVNQRPLPPAEGKVLKAGQLQEILVGINGHPMRVQVTPAGSAASSTETA